MLIVYARQLTRTSSGDATYLAAGAAAKEAGVSINDAAAVLMPLIRETGSHFPEGFL